MTPRIANMMYRLGLTLHLTPREPETGTPANWYECAWFVAQMLDKKGRYLFDGEGLKPEDAIADLLVSNGLTIEELCQKVETAQQGGHDAPPLSS